MLAGPMQSTVSERFQPVLAQLREQGFCHTPKHFAADQGCDIPATCTVSSVHARLLQYYHQNIRVKRIQTVQAQSQSQVKYLIK